jgi:hypothetical protein
MGAFAGMLNKNEIYTSLYNMIIGQQVFSDRISDHGALVDKARIDGGLYGDTKLFYSADALETHAWGNDAEATNLLALDRPDAPECQAVTIDTFRQIRLTLDDYLSKRAWSTEGAFSQFNSVMEGMLSKTKRIYDTTTYNAFVGTDIVTAQTFSVSVSSTATAEDEAKLVAQKIADIKDSLADLSRDFNEYGQATIFNKEDVKVVWNSSVVNRLNKVDLPAIFHTDGLAPIGDVVNAKYFGTKNTTSKAGDGKTVRSLVEQTIGSNHYFAGEVIKSGDTAPAGTSYTEDASILCKIYIKLPPYMSAFEVGTSFDNPRSLTKNRYLTFGHNTLEHFKGYPCITIKKA